MIIVDRMIATTDHQEVMVESPTMSEEGLIDRHRIMIEEAMIGEDMIGEDMIEHMIEDMIGNDNGN
ncbi:21047_t:CDS:2 [Entrophospora sp. SA101]|nr:21047_t:CDS:2 [Entrophospora sp. SA101]